MNRRKFFAFLPFAPVSAVMATAAVAKAPCESFAPDTALMTLKANKDFDEETQVSMAVGKDGHLWLKIGDSWKRIVTE